jgi:hypothetical protein
MAASSLWQRFYHEHSRGERVFHLLRHLASNDARIKVAAGDEAADDRFSLRESE